ncbi:uncharacterized protein LOC131020435 isoform X4 [Salvia miltiorrhiza]|uniref:uncharacterized protein LOC131020435 isoform X4 n=1 Tax=Salvia miltiorrhiza TaxID=226208 RepID=UPI0025AC1BB5|nr:uncharacterized protein LOC131020435 isoform X4 [Salvia miltiorrhiza]
MQALPRRRWPVPSHSSVLPTNQILLRYLSLCHGFSTADSFSQHCRRQRPVMAPASEGFTKHSRTPTSPHRRRRSLPTLVYRRLLCHGILQDKRDLGVSSQYNIRDSFVAVIVYDVVRTTYSHCSACSQWFYMFKLFKILGCMGARTIFKAESYCCNTVRAFCRT